jgi:hypothetical protein
MWGFITMLLAPNVLAAIVIHVRLSYLITRQGGSSLICSASYMPHKPAAYPLYIWLGQKGGFALLLAASLVLCPYWLLCEIPILVSAAMGHLSSRWKSSRANRGAWLHIGRFCSFLSLLMSVTESPFSVVVFTFNYIRGASYNFPTLISDWGFVFTVGTALLHIVLEAWRLVPFVKQGRFKERMKDLFLHVIVTSTASSATSDTLSLGRGAHGSEGGWEAAEADMRIAVASADDISNTIHQQQISPQAVMRLRSIKL